MRDLTTARWMALSPLLERVRPRGGREFADLRRTFAGIVFRLRTGVPWRDLPARFGPWQRAWSLHRRWAAWASGTRCSPKHGPWAGRTS